MGRIERIRKLRRLEARTEAVTASVTRLEEVRRERVLHAAIERLDTDVLHVLVRLVDVVLEDLEDAAGGGAPVDLYLYAGDARAHDALVALERAFAAVRAAAIDEELSRGE
jgi:hypothetical protein